MGFPIEHSNCYNYNDNCPWHDNKLHHIFGSSLSDIADQFAYLKMHAMIEHYTLLQIARMFDKIDPHYTLLTTLCDKLQMIASYDWIATKSL